MSKLKVYVQYNDSLTCDMWERHGYTLTEDYNDADIICFIGGADVSPAMYLEENTDSFCSTAMDLESVGLFTRTCNTWRLLVGICRGGQFLNVMMGGSMVQHIDGHGSHLGHSIDGPYGPVTVRSDHHQGMVPSSKTNNGAFYSPDGNAEIIMYDEVDVLCFQPHPEYTPKDSDTEQLFFKILEEYYGC